MSIWILCLVVLLLAFSSPLSGQPLVDPTDLDLDGTPGVAAPPDEIPPLEPSALVGTGALLIDRSHGNSFDVSGFTNYLLSKGWSISELVAGPVTYEALAGSDILLVPTRDGGLGSIFPFSASEVGVIQEFLADGKGLWVLHDNVDPSGINTLTTAFGVSFQYDYVQDPSNNEGETFWPSIQILSAHPVTQGVTDYGYYLGDCLNVTAPSFVLATADEDAYSLFCPTGSYPPTLAAWENVGRAVFAGDITPLHPNYYLPRLDSEEQLLLQNTVSWLLGTQPTATSHSSWGSLKTRF